jgi:RNA 2',3'-cyclic 3'-phosphodiesterase
VPETGGMRLFSALVPPEAARQELAEAVAAVDHGTVELDPTPVDLMRIPVTSFGNVAQRDADQLFGLLRRAAAEWSRPEVCFNGSAALEWPGDESVWAKLEGDAEELREIGRGVPIAVKPLGFLVDRRAFRPWLSVGTITEHTTAPYLERLVAALEDFKGMPWQVDRLTVIRKVPQEAPGQVEEVVIDEVPLAGS